MVVQMSPKRSKRSTQNGAVQKKTLLVAQEISFAKVLAGNDKKLRDRGVKRLRKWLTSRSRSENELEDDDYLRIWKGLFYCVWMSDKPLVQEELCENISSLIHCFGKAPQAFGFMKAFFLTMASEWNGIDQHRINKFLMLVRRFFRQCLAYCEQNDWRESFVQELDTLFKLTYFPDYTVKTKLPIPGGLILHITDIFLEEIAKVSKGNLPEHALLALLKRFVLFIAVSPDRYLSEAISNNIFDRLIEQSPDAMEYNEKFAAWKKLGFPGDSLHCMERVDEDTEGEEDEEDEEEETNSNDNMEFQDPRAGEVDVYLPTVTFNPKNVEDVIKSCQFKKFTTTATRNMLGRLARKFGRLAKGDYPLGYYTVPKPPEGDFKEMAEEAEGELQELKDQLMKESFVPKKSDKMKHGSADGYEDENFKETGEALSKLPQKLKSVKNDQKSNKIDDNNKDIKSNPNTLIKIKKRDLTGETETNSKSSLNQKIKTKLRERQVALDTAQPKALPKHIINGSVGKTAPKKRRFSLESNIVSNTQFVVTELSCPKDTELLAPSKDSKPRQRASCPAKLAPLKLDCAVSSGSDTPTVAMQSKRLKRKKDSWDDPLQEGETEIVISRDMIKAKRKSLESANLAFQSMEIQKSVDSPVSSASLKPQGSSKKVNFVLQKNRAQGTSEYFKTLRENPEIPYDAKKKPSHGVLKASPYSSPINPFYLRKLKRRQEKTK